MQKRSFGDGSQSNELVLRVCTPSPKHQLTIILHDSLQSTFFFCNFLLAARSEVLTLSVHAGGAKASPNVGLYSCCPRTVVMEIISLEQRIQIPNAHV